MNAYPLIFSGSHPSNNSGEYDVWPPLFCEGFSSMPPELLSEDLEFLHSEPPAKYSDDPNGLEVVDKKWLHKAFERERRKDMKSRYSALRSLLPEENVRGKTSITDQLSVAADYIRLLQVKVEELASKREEMEKMKLESNSNKKLKVDNANESEAFPFVTLNFLGSRLVIAINTLQGQTVLSNLLLAVEEEGLQVLTATSFVTGDKVFYTVHCKVSDVKSFTSGIELRQKLWQLIREN